MIVLFGKKINLAMLIQWVIFMPIILPLCIIFGALHGAVSLVKKMIDRMATDIESVEVTELIS